MQSQSSNGPELRGSGITLDKITAKTDESNRHTKIVCTLGPACWEVDQLETLIEAGMSVARFNFSHGDHSGHQACLDRLRQAAANKNANVGKSNTFKEIQHCDDRSLNLSQLYDRIFCNLLNYFTHTPMI
jgi:hypothetical protein